MDTVSYTGIKIIKLLNGQEIIGDIVETQDIRDWVVIKEPRLINFEMDDKGNVRIGLAPFSMFTSEEKFVLNSTCILSIFSSVPNLEQAYRQQTSGIVLANENQLKQLDLFKGEQK
jgi:hypothetical protein